MVGQAGDDGFGGEESLAALGVVVAGYDDGSGLCGRVVLRKVSLGGEFGWVEDLCDVSAGGNWGVGEGEVDVCCSG